MSHKPYIVKNVISKSLEDEHLHTAAKVCKSCSPVLQKYSDTFMSLKQQGRELKKRRKINPHPKKPDMLQYWDLVKQNEWLRNNVFDTMGNYLFCSSCIHHRLGVSYQRLSRQRNVKRKEHMEPLRCIKKSEFEKRALAEYVVMPTGINLSFMKWWKSLT